MKGVALRFGPDLVEEAVFLVIHAGMVDRRLTARIERRRGRVYDLPSARDRETGFMTAAMDAFTGIGLDRVFRETLAGLPNLSALAELRVMKARSPADEHADLFVRSDLSNENHQSGVVWLLVDRFREPETMRRFLQRELLHLSDMLDERFGYNPDAVPNNRSPGRQNLFRDRYRLLWELSVTGRLERSGKLPAGTVDSLRPAFDRVFGALEAAEREESFQRVAGDECPRHELLVTLAGREPSGVGLGKDQDTPRRGEACPLCQFPTFDWMEPPSSIAVEVAAAIQATFSSWQPSDGICCRCHEVYELGAAQRPPDPPTRGEFRA